MAALPPGEKRGAHLGSWPGPRDSLDALEKREISCFY